MFPLLAALGFGSVVAEVAKLAVPFPADLRALFVQVAANEGGPVTADILHSIGWQESGLNVHAPRGTSGEHGMMQIMPATGAHFGYSEAQLDDITTNVRVAAKLWNENARAIGPSVSDGLAAYNAGLRAGQVKRDSQGSYTNGRYVFDAYSKYLAVRLAAAAPTAILRRV